MRKTHNLSSHHHPREIQFVAVPLAPVRTTRVIATWYSLEHGVNPVLMCVACVFFFVFLSCIVCHSSFIFLVNIRVIQCVEKWACYFKVKCMYMVLCMSGNLNEKQNQKRKFTLQRLGVKLIHLNLFTQFLLSATSIRFQSCWSC